MIRSTVLAAASAALMGIVPLAAPANADKYPGDPPGCESTTYGHSLICDGPIQPDGTWQRCAYRRVIYAYQSPVMCRYVDITNCQGLLGFDVPNHHIDY